MRPGAIVMRDLLYVAGTVVFFALMLAYVTGCERLGRASTTEAATEAAASPERRP